MATAFFAATFLAAVFLAAVFFAAAFLAAVFFAAAFFAAFLAAFAARAGRAGSPITSSPSISSTRTRALSASAILSGNASSVYLPGLIAPSARFSRMGMPSPSRIRCASSVRDSIGSTDGASVPTSFTPASTRRRASGCVTAGYGCGYAQGSSRSRVRNRTRSASARSTRATRSSSREVRPTASITRTGPMNVSTGSAPAGAPLSTTWNGPSTCVPV